MSTEVTPQVDGTGPFLDQLGYSLTLYMTVGKEESDEE
jgi:hypothetical protein